VATSKGDTMNFKTKLSVFKKNFWRDKQLYLMILLPTIPFAIFHYLPMYGLQIAFRNYRIADGILGSEWVGFKWFEEFLSNPRFGEIFFNTLALALYSLVLFPIPIILALVFNALNNKKYLKAVQTVSYMPHFISTAVFVGIMDMILSPVVGVYGNMFRLFGGEGYPVDFRTAAGAFRHLYVWSGVWKNSGWDTVLYTSALSAVSMELHEAARIDGASRFKRIIHIDLPSIMPTVALMFVMRVGGLVSVGFEKAYMMQNTLNLRTSEIISTYVYKKGIQDFRGFSFGAAVGLFNTMINLVLMITANTICKKLTDDEVSLF
jgi:putative aldouronate transport system permease protein